LTTTYGSLTMDAAGNWTYTLDNANPAVQALARRCNHAGPGNGHIGWTAPRMWSR
jgi:hypothetical protein